MLELLEMKRRVVDIPFSSLRRARKALRSRRTCLLPFSRYASNFVVNSAMRCRRLSKLKSGCGRWVIGESE